MFVEIEVSYTFKGKLTVEAESYTEARRIATEDFGCVLGACSTSNDKHVKDWNMGTHPDGCTIGPFTDIGKY